VPGALTEAWSTVLVIETDGFWVIVVVAGSLVTGAVSGRRDGGRVHEVLPALMSAWVTSSWPCRSRPRRR